MNFTDIFLKILNLEFRKKIDLVCRFNKLAARFWRDLVSEKKYVSADRSLFNWMYRMTDQRFQRITSTTALHFSFVFKKNA